MTRKWYEVLPAIYLGKPSWPKKQLEAGGNCEAHYWNATTYAKQKSLYVRKKCYDVPTECERILWEIHC